MTPPPDDADESPSVELQPVTRRERLRQSFREHPRLSLSARILLFVAGWTLVLIGIAGLALPGIQGVLTILLGVAVLSAVSESAYRLLRWAFRRWPRLMDRIDRIRDKVHEKLHRDDR